MSKQLRDVQQDLKDALATLDASRLRLDAETRALDRNRDVTPEYKARRKAERRKAELDKLKATITAALEEARTAMAHQPDLSPQRLLAEARFVGQLGELQWSEFDETLYAPSDKRKMQQAHVGNSLLVELVNEFKCANALAEARMLPDDVLASRLAQARDAGTLPALRVLLLEAQSRTWRDDAAERAARVTLSRIANNDFPLPEGLEGARQDAAEVARLSMALSDDWAGFESGDAVLERAARNRRSVLEIGQRGEAGYHAWRQERDAAVAEQAKRLDVVPAVAEGQ
jgi:hypothetical protein